MIKTWQAKLEINIGNVLYNINQIKEHIGENVDIMPIIKDDGYRTDLDKKFEVFESAKIKIVGVAIVDEAINLRNLGYKR